MEIFGGWQAVGDLDGDRQAELVTVRRVDKTGYIAGATAMRADWTSVEDLNSVIGDFVWTSLDYLGEGTMTIGC